MGENTDAESQLETEEEEERANLFEELKRFLLDRLPDNLECVRIQGGQIIRRRRAPAKRVVQ